MVEMMKPISVNFQCGLAVNSAKKFTAKTLKHESKHYCSLPPFATVDAGG